jgi:hypothetical protein
MAAVPEVGQARAAGRNAVGCRCGQPDLVPQLPAALQRAV